MIAVLVLIFPLQDAVEEEQHKCPVPTESYFQYQSSYIYGAELTKNSFDRSSSCPHGRGAMRKNQQDLQLPPHFVPVS